MNELKLKAMELAVAAAGANHAYDPDALVQMARKIEAYLTENVFVATNTVATYTVTGVQ